LAGRVSKGLPIEARCHLGLAALHLADGQIDEASAARVHAITMLPSLGMSFCPRPFASVVNRVSIRRVLVRLKDDAITIGDTGDLARPLSNQRSETMRVVVMIKATKNSEAGVMPSEKLLREMGRFNEELVKAGVMLAGEGLHPSRKGKRVRLSGGTKTVTNGPFAETKELVAGFWIWQVKSMEEALEWVKRCPDPMPGEEAEIEIRPIFEAEDFGNELTPELRAQEERLRAEVERQRKS
jgi:hypothetical protein